ncbi:unnamed protein product, partial [Rotaria magnacalcarata]
QSMSESTISSSSNSLVSSRHNSPSEDTNNFIADLSGSAHDMDSKSSSATITPVTKSFPKPLFDSKVFVNEENTGQTSPPETRAKNILTQGTSSQRASTRVPRTDSHDSATSALSIKSGKSHKVNIS